MCFTWKLNTAAFLKQQRKTDSTYFNIVDGVVNWLCKNRS